MNTHLDRKPTSDLSSTIIHTSGKSLCQMFATYFQTIFLNCILPWSPSTTIPHHTTYSTPSRALLPVSTFQLVHPCHWRKRSSCRAQLIQYVLRSGSSSQTMLTFSANHLDQHHQPFSCYCCFTWSIKSCSITPLLKKYNIDKDDLSGQVLSF